MLRLNDKPINSHGLGGEEMSEVCFIQRGQRSSCVCSHIDFYIQNTLLLCTSVHNDKAVLIKFLLLFDLTL